MYGGKFAFQNRLGQLVVGRKFTIFALFYFVFEGKFQVQAPRGAYIRRGDLTEGFLRYDFEGLIFGAAYTWRGLFSEFYGIFTLIETNCQTNWETLLPSNAKWPLPAGAHNLLPVDVPYYLNYLNDTHTILSRKQTQKYGKCLLPLKMAKKVTGRV